LLDAANKPVLDSSGQTITVPLSSVERYRRTLLFPNLTPLQLHDLAAGPSQFLMAGGQPLVSLAQMDSGVYLQDDWRVRPNLSLSAGLRWEAQNRIRDWKDFAPRLGFAWAPGGHGKRSAKTVIRGGAGVFYDRFGESLSLEALRYDGVNRHLYLLHDPGFFPIVPTMADLAAGGALEIVRRIQPGLRAPTMTEAAVAVERQLPLKLVLSVNYINTHGSHLLRSRNINAPLPHTDGLRPYSGGNIYQYESSGVLNQNQIVANLSRRFARGLSLFGYYAYGRALSNTDGPDSFPMNQYDLRGEYGRAATDVRHRGVLGASMATRLGFRLSPFLLGRSGAPVNIITGEDANGDGLYTDRPAFASDPRAAGIVSSRLGVFDPNPGPGTVIIPRNYGQGPAYFTLNLRLSRTFGFGGSREGKKLAAHGPKERGLLPDESGLRGLLRDGSTGQRFNLTLSVQARNILNHVNPGLPVGNMSSALFGQSNFLAAASGPESMTSGDNRRVLLQLKFSF
jgi:hypothetical protein